MFLLSQPTDTARSAAGVSAADGSYVEVIARFGCPVATRRVAPGAEWDELCLHHPNLPRGRCRWPMLGRPAMQVRPGAELAGWTGRGFTTADSVRWVAHYHALRTTLTGAAIGIDASAPQGRDLTCARAPGLEPLGETMGAGAAVSPVEPTITICGSVRLQSSTWKIWLRGGRGTLPVPTGVDDALPVLPDENGRRAAQPRRRRAGGSRLRSGRTPSPPVG